MIVLYIIILSEYPFVLILYTEYRPVKPCNSIEEGGK